MRKKIEELRNREEGFTLVELLAVIVILGIIVAIAIPAIGNTINNADTQATAAEDELVVDAARLYFVEDTNKAKESVTEYELIQAGYLDLRRTEEDDAPTATSQGRKVNRNTTTGELTLNEEEE